MSYYKTNYLHSPAESLAEAEALEEMCQYLVSIGKYQNKEDAKNDALERISFFEKINLYEKDPGLKESSTAKKQVHALIYGHNLHDTIVENSGFLPDAKTANSSNKGRMATSSKSNRSILFFVTILAILTLLWVLS